MEHTEETATMEHDDVDQQPQASTSDEYLSGPRGSLKRDREASYEPQTPKSENEELIEARERKKPAAKKGRLQMVEEGQESPPSPPLDHPFPQPSTPPTTNQTPPETMLETPGEPAKLQHLREKVKDMSWQEHGSPQRGGPSARPKSIYDTAMADAQQDEDEFADEEQVPSTENDVHSEDVVIQDAHAAPTTTAETITSSTSAGDAPAASQADLQQQDTHNEAIESIAHPEPSSEPSSALAPAVELSAAQDASATDEPPNGIAIVKHQRKNSDSDPSSDLDMSKSPSRKRKLVTRGSNFANDSQINHEEYSKRAKDDEGLPKPIHEAAEEVEQANTSVEAAEPPVVASTPKTSGFASFSGASPFAKLASSTGATTFGGISASKLAEPQPTKSIGFGAFSSTSSPFAAVSANSPSLFGSSNPINPLRPNSPDAAALSTSLPKSPPVVPLPNRSRSPSVSSLNRRKSPPPAGTKPKPGAAFGSYNNNSFGFAAVTSGFGGPAASRHSPSPSLDASNSRKNSLADVSGDSDEPRGREAASPTPGAEAQGMKRGASWGELLGVAGAEASDDEGSEKKKLKMQEIELHTGEEDEDTVHQVRAKLYWLDRTGAYKERGVGALKLNVRKQNGGAPRLVMRADGIHRLILNAALFPGMMVAVGQDPKFVRVTSLENGKPANYAIKVGNPKAAEELKVKITEHLPSEAAHAKEEV